MKLLDNVFVYPWSGQGNNCNSYALGYAVDGESCYALFDPGHIQVPVPLLEGGRYVGMGRESGVDVLLASLRADSILPEQVKLVINTHAHPDHCESSIWWKQQHQALVALHEAEIEPYQKVLRHARAASGNNQSNGNALEPDIFLREGELRLGQPDALSLQVLHVPGHSAGSVAFYYPETKVLFGGDLIFYRSMGRTDLPGGSTTQMFESIRRLSELDVEHLLTGHAYGHIGILSGRQEIALNFKQVLTYMF